MKKTITGFHAIEEILKAEKKTPKTKDKNSYPIEIVYSKQGPRVKKILELAQNLNIPIRQEDNKNLDKHTKHLPAMLQDHRGIILFMETKNNSFNITADEFFARLSEKEKSVVVILDSITDPHNIGSIVRSADQFGIDGIIIPENGSGGLENSGFEVILKISSGASAWVPVIPVNNIVRVAERLKKEGFWIYGADTGGSSIYDFKFAEKTVIVMGSEGNGMSRLMEKTCDAVISIPTQGKLDSLNVSIAAGILFYEVRRNFFIN